MTQQSLTAVVLGAGMAGILAAIKLREMGIQDVTVYEKADRIGGTWRENTYPGLTCDVPSHSYTYSFEPNPDWSHLMPPGDEIQAYFEAVVDKYDLAPLLRCNETVSRCVYGDDGWSIETASGITQRADIVIAATGVLHKPRYPSIPGQEDFKGAMFHTARWDHSVPLDGQRVAVIGTGSTGVQIVSALAGRCSALACYQRSAQWIQPWQNFAYSEEERAAFRNDPALVKRMQNDPELEAAIDAFSEAIADPDSPGMQAIEASCLEYLESAVQDPVLKEKLRPNYRAACKRLVRSPDFYQAIQQPNVELVTESIERFEATGIRTSDGVLREFDVIALATGFHADRFMRPIEFEGRNGVTLEEAWSDGPKAYQAVALPDFPNLFMLNGPNGPVGNFSLIEIAEAQWGYIAQLIEKLQSGECRSIAAKREALERFERERIAQAKKTIFATGCSSWYLDQNGVPATWPWTRQRFHESMQKPDLASYELLG